MYSFYLTHIFTFDFQFTDVQFVNSTHHNPYHYHRRYTECHCIVFPQRHQKEQKRSKLYIKTNQTLLSGWNCARRSEAGQCSLVSRGGGRCLFDIYVYVDLNLKSVNLKGRLQVHRLWLGIQCRRGGSAPGHHHPPHPPHHHHCHPNPGQ